MEEKHRSIKHNMYADVIFKKIFNVVSKRHLNKNKSKQAGSALLWEAKEKQHQEHVIASAILRGGFYTVYFRLACF